MNFAAPSLPPKACAKVASDLPVAGDTYIGLLVKLLDIGEQLKIQSAALEHARERAAKRDWAGVQIGLAVLCCAASDIRKISAAANEKIAPDLDSATLAYGE
jgi:hypothetical protein